LKIYSKYAFGASLYAAIVDTSADFTFVVQEEVRAGRRP